MRKVTELVLKDGGIDRHFEIQQMPATKQERWINKALTMIISKNANRMTSIFNNFSEQEKQERSANEVAMAVRSGNIDLIFSLLQGIDYVEIEPLYNELLECVSYIPDENNKDFKQPMTMKIADSIIEDFRNLYKLRFESFKANFSFFTDTAEEQPQQLPTEQHSTTITIRKNTAESK